MKPTLTQKISTAIVCSLMGLFVYFSLTSIGTLRYFLVLSNHWTHNQINQLSIHYIYGDTVGLFLALFLLNKIKLKTTLISTFFISIFCFTGLAFIKDPILMIWLRFFSGIFHAFVFLSILRLITHYYNAKAQGFYFSLCISIILIGGVLSGFPLRFLLYNAHLTPSILTISTLFLIVGIFSIFVIPNINHLHTNQDSNYKTILKCCKLIPNWLIGLNIATLSVPIMLLGALYGSIYLHATGLTLSQASNVCSALFVGFIVGGISWGIIDKSCQKRKILILCGSISTGIGVILFFYIHQVWPLVGLAFLIGGTSSVQSLSYALISDLNQTDNRSHSMGIVNVLIMFLTGTFQYGLSHNVNHNDILRNHFFNIYISGLTLLSIIFILVLLRNSNTPSKKRSCTRN